MHQTLRQQELQRRVRLAQRRVAELQAQRMTQLQMEAQSCWCQPQRLVQPFAMRRRTLAGLAPHKAALACKQPKMWLRLWKHSLDGCWAEYVFASVRSRARQQQQAQVHWPMQ